jgi:hypothetical protein
VAAAFAEAAEDRGGGPEEEDERAVEGGVEGEAGTQWPVANRAVVKVEDAARLSPIFVARIQGVAPKCFERPANGQPGHRDAAVIVRDYVPCSVCDPGRAELLSIPVSFVLRRARGPITRHAHGPPQTPRVRATGRVVLIDTKQVARPRHRQSDHRARDSGAGEPEGDLAARAFRAPRYTERSNAKQSGSALRCGSGAAMRSLCCYVARGLGQQNPMTIKITPSRKVATMTRIACGATVLATSSAMCD